MRVLVTGSRDWPYPSVVEDELYKVHESIKDGAPLVVVHGACPNGADKLASLWVGYQAGSIPEIGEEPHPANWTKYGKAAGFIRNQEMVNLGADLCLAFCYMGSKGTKDCINRASNARIPLRILELDIVELA